MENKHEYCMVISTCGNKESAKQIAKSLIDAKLAACVQMLPVASMYVWQDKVCEDDETALLIKTKTALFDKIVSVIKENHSYEVPEIIQLPVTDGLPEYLSWIDKMVE